MAPPPRPRRRGGTTASAERIRASGKFLYAGEEKLYVRGVTYGTFDGPSEGGFPNREAVAADFAAMAASGVNTVRTYTVAPVWLLDLAGRHGLRVLVGIPWEQHLTFLDDRRRCHSIVRAVRSAVRACASHPAVMGYVLGNEIPAGIVRWHGRQRVERFIERLYWAAKAEDPDALLTYANFPSTEFLDLPFLDFVCFNVFLEAQDALERYLARLQTLCGDRPLVIGELGLDSLRHGLHAQADSLASQLRVAYAAGCAGCFVFAWTDEWHRGGQEVGDWSFGVVDRQRRPKPALAAIRSAFAAVPFAAERGWPKVSVVVCTYNGARTIGDCMRALCALDYPDFEVIVVDDGSTDGTGDMAEAHGARVIRTENCGLSAARNTGTEASDGAIVAFCDDDCMPDEHWLRYLVDSLLASGNAGVGGPNVPPRDSLVAESVGHAPGGPMHVLISDRTAEHIPGCNMAFRRETLDQLEGFDPRFRVAGDDVDLCWRVQDAGGTLGFSPAALVWHRARSSIGAYLRQQAGYGRAEALLERKWPERYNGKGHVSWSGTVYGGKVRRSFGRWRWRVYYGTSGSGLFQSVYRRHSGGSAFPLAPEWYLLLASLAAGSAYRLAGPSLPIGLEVRKVPLMLILFAICLVTIALQAASWTMAVVLPASVRLERRALIRLLTFALCLSQPIARLWGRLHRGLTPWRWRGPRVLAVPRRRRASVWSERWIPVDGWVERLWAQLRPCGAQVLRGGDFDTWDLDVRVGPLASARVRVVAEDHGQGRQMARFRIWPRCSPGAASGIGALAALSVSAAVQHAPAAAVALALACLWLVAATAAQAATAVALPARTAERLGEAPSESLDTGEETGGHPLSLAMGSVVSQEQT